MTQDLNSVPYDAPLGFQEPAWTWTRYYAYLNDSSKTLTTEDVPHQDLTGRFVIITGGNNGIGREAAIFFAECGANVIIACRDPPAHELHPETVVKELKQAAAGRGHTNSVLEYWKIDMTKLSTVQAFAERWLSTDRPLDILCNNAGMGRNPGGVLKVLNTEDGFEYVHQCNFSAHALLTYYLLPSLAKAAEPRIVCTTSCFTFLGHYDLNNWDGQNCQGVAHYANNKLYFQIWLTELHERLLRSPKYRHITIQGIHPGYVNTGIWEFPVGTGIIAFAESLVKGFLQFLASRLAITPEQGSYAIRYAATSVEAGPDPAVQGVGEIGGKGGGRWFNRISAQPNMPHNRDPDSRCRVWRKVNEELRAKERGLLDGLES